MNIMEKYHATFFFFENLRDWEKTLKLLGHSEIFLLFSLSQITTYIRVIEAEIDEWWWRGTTSLQVSSSKVRWKQ